MYNNILFSIGLTTLELKGMDNDALCKYVKENIGEEISRLALGKVKRKLSHLELLNRDYYHGRFSNKIKDRVVYNWEDDEL